MAVGSVTPFCQRFKHAWCTKKVVLLLRVEPCMQASNSVATNSKYHAMNGASSVCLTRRASRGHIQLLAGFSIEMTHCNSKQTCIKLMASLKIVFALSTFSRSRGFKLGFPKRQDSSLNGCGSWAPCRRRCRARDFSRAQKHVPHMSPKWTATGLAKRQLLSCLDFIRVAQIYGESWHLKCTTICTMIQWKHLEAFFAHTD